MTISRLALLRGTGWTLGSYAASFLFRFGTNIILARLLAPDIFGIMLIINSIKLGIELMSDLGIQQSIIYSQNAEDRDFYNTAWTIQIIRGFLIFFLFLAISIPIANFYEIPALAIQVSAASSIFTGLGSLSLALGLKKMDFASRNIFDAAVDFASLLVQIALAYVSPTVWALVVGGVIGSAIRCLASYLLPAPRHRLTLRSPHAREILSFGKWIFVSSLVFFACNNVDRLYLGTVAPLAILGVFGIARNIAELPATLAVRLSHFIVFPLVSSSQIPRATLHQQATPLRAMSLLAAAASLSMAAAGADILIRAIYDDRYQDAGWMLPILLLGVWISVVCSFNEAALLGFGKPRYAALANGLKLACLVLGLPLAFSIFGLFGAIVLTAVSDIFRYAPLLLGQRREMFSFLRQDVLLTLAMFGLFVGWVVLRRFVGWGTPFDNLPLG